MTTSLFKIEKFFRSLRVGQYVTATRIAIATGLSPATIVRALKSWKEQGVLETTRINKGRGQPEIGYRWKRQ